MIASEVIESMGSLTGNVKCLFPKSNYMGDYIHENELECEVRSLKDGGANAILVLKIKDKPALTAVVMAALCDLLENVDSSNVTAADFFEEVKGPLIDSVGFPGQAATINLECGDYTLYLTTGTLNNNDNYFEFAVAWGEQGVSFERTLLELLNSRRCAVH